MDILWPLHLGLEDDGSNSGGGNSPLRTQALLARLTTWDSSMSAEIASELVEQHGAEVIHAWLDALERDLKVRSVAASLIYRLKNGKTPPDNDRHNRSGTSDTCSFCHATGAVVLDVSESDPDHGQAILCPYCSAN